MTESETAADALSFEDALSQLEAIVSELERGETPLEQTIARFERGIALARRCEDRLNEADRKVAILLREGARVVEVDMESGERRAVHEDPGEEPTQRSAPRSEPERSAPRSEPQRSLPAREPRFDQGPPDPPPRGSTPSRGSLRTEPPRSGGPEGARDPGGPQRDQGQMSLGQAFAIKDPSEMDDDDIPF